MILTSNFIDPLNHYSPMNNKRLLSFGRCAPSFWYLPYAFQRGGLSLLTSCHGSCHRAFVRACLRRMPVEQADPLHGHSRSCSSSFGQSWPLGYSGRPWQETSFVHSPEFGIAGLAPEYPLCGNTVKEEASSHAAQPFRELLPKLIRVDWQTGHLTPSPFRKPGFRSGFHDPGRTFQKCGLIPGKYHCGWGKG